MPSTSHQRSGRVPLGGARTRNWKRDQEGGWLAQRLPIWRRPPRALALPIRRSRPEVPPAQRRRSLFQGRGRACAGLHHETQLPLPLGLSSLEAMASAAKARQRLARNCMVSRTCASMVSTARRSQASARCRHCSRVLDGMAQRASLLVLRAGARIAATGARKGSNWRYLNLGVTIPCRNTERTPVQQLRVREPPGSQPPRRQVVVAHPVVLAPTAADGLEHRVGNQHDPSCRMRARIWRSERSRHAGAAPPSRYRSQVIRRNHDGKALNGSSRASAGVGRGSLP